MKAYFWHHLTINYEKNISIMQFLQLHHLRKLLLTHTLTHTRKSYTHTIHKLNHNIYVMKIALTRMLLP